MNSKFPPFICAVILTICLIVFYCYNLQITRPSQWRTITIPDPKSTRMTSMESTPTTTLEPPPSWFRSFQLDKLDMLKDMETQRPLFNFTILPWKIVRDVPDALSEKNIRWSMIIAIKSHFGRLSKRDLIRRTWGSIQYLDGVRLEVIFVVATAKNSDEESQLNKENELYGDLLQVSMAEVYQDIGLKVIAAMQWVKGNLPNQDWIYSSCDDDIIPNLGKLVRVIDNLARKIDSSKPNVSNIPIQCGFSYRPGPAPKRAGKWKVDVNTYPYPNYPTFCLGAFYSIPVKMSNEIYTVSRKIPYFKMDDVWITGFLRLKFCDDDDAVVRDFLFDRADKNCGISTIESTGVTHVPTMSEQRFSEKWNAREEDMLNNNLEFIKRNTTAIITQSNQWAD